jgi:hypothetical protein
MRKIIFAVLAGSLFSLLVYAGTLSNVSVTSNPDIVGRTATHTISFTTATGDLDNPATPTVAVVNANGTTSWGYEITAFSENGETLPSPEGLVTDGTSTLDSTNYISITWNPIPGAVYYGVYRTTAGGTPTTTGLIATTTATGTNDTGLPTIGGLPPTVNTTADIKSIEITFPVGFDITGAALGSYTSADGEANPTLSTSSQTAIVTFETASRGTANVTYTITLTGIVNATSSGKYTANIVTKGLKGVAIDSGSGTFALRPENIKNLICDASGQAGAIWLWWTVPMGIVNSGQGYQLKYQQGNSIDWNTALTYTQDWLRADPGTLEQKLVTGFNPNTQYTFAMKVLGNDNTSSTVSNAVTCYAPAAAQPSTDKIAPTSQITNPKSGDKILVGTKTKIEGTAKDEGGSSVQKVEISFDGKNWFLVNPVKLENGVLYWEYFWVPKEVGEYKIQTRATDWVGNVEKPSEGIKVSVVSELPKAPPAPQVPMTIEQLKAKIIEIQLKLIQLIQQLIQILQEKLAQLKR